MDAGTLYYEFVLRNPYLRLVFGRTTSSWNAFVRAWFFCSLPAFAVIGGAAIDRTFFIQADVGRGLFRHFGFWGYVFTSPLIAFLTWLLLKGTAEITDRVTMYTTELELPDGLKRLIDFHTRILQLRTWFSLLLVVGAFLGFCVTLLNMKWVMDPIPHYGANSFDSKDHLAGFITMRLYVGLLSMVLYPVAVFLCLEVTWFIHDVLSYIWRKGIVRIEFFHPDNCGGFSAFGSLNLTIMGIYFLILIELLAAIRTHSGHIQIQIIPLCVISILMVLQSIGAVYSIHRCVRRKRAEALRSVTDQLDSGFKSVQTENSTFSNLLLLRNHLLQIKTFPYSRYVLGLVNLLRFAPAAIGLLKLLSRVYSNVL
jgi:hypothetical protein